MKTFSQLNCILFTILAACGGKSEQSTVESAPSVERAPVVAGFGEVKPMEKPAVVAPKAEVGKVAVAEVEHWIPTKASECMSLGKEMAAKGEHVRARELFEAAAKLDRKAAEPHVELARSFIATNDKALALRHANKAVKLAPESSQAYNTLGRAELLRHDYEAATIAFRQATELNADNVWAWNNLGLVHLTLKNYQEAVNALTEATSKKGAEGYMWNNLGLAYEQLDQLDDARDAFDSGAKLGSAAAKASRKRLEGVDTVVVVKSPKQADEKPEPAIKTYEDREEMPEVPADIEGGDDDVIFEKTEPADEPATPESKPEEPAPKPEVKPDSTT